MGRRRHATQATSKPKSSDGAAVSGSTDESEERSSDGAHVIASARSAPRLWPLAVVLLIQASYIALIYFVSGVYASPGHLEAQDAVALPQQTAELSVRIHRQRAALVSTRASRDVASVELRIAGPRPAAHDLPTDHDHPSAHDDEAHGEATRGAHDSGIEDGAARDANGGSPSLAAVASTDADGVATWSIQAPSTPGVYAFDVAASPGGPAPATLLLAVTAADNPPLLVSVEALDPRLSPAPLLNVTNPVVLYFRRGVGEWRPRRPQFAALGPRPMVAWPADESELREAATRFAGRFQQPVWAVSANVAEAQRLKLAGIQVVLLGVAAPGTGIESVPSWEAVVDRVQSRQR